MSVESIIMMVVFLTAIWGGLLASAIHLVRTPDSSLDNEE